MPWFSTVDLHRLRNSQLATLADRSCWAPWRAPGVGAGAQSRGRSCDDLTMSPKKKEEAKSKGLLDRVGLGHHGKLLASFAPSKLAPKAKSVKCTNCKMDATVYCVDCNRELCIFCTTLLHHPSTKFEKHSLEDIVQEDARPEVKIISPILLELILVFGAFFFYSGASISPEYFSGQRLELPPGFVIAAWLWLE
eukprot:Skav216763  [mRNA]  locus=scaffold1917:132428:139891:+ [translate_table: standard]